MSAGNHVCLPLLAILVLFSLSRLIIVFLIAPGLFVPVVVPARAFSVHTSDQGESLGQNAEGRRPNRVQGAQHDGDKDNVAASYRERGELRRAVLAYDGGDDEREDRREEHGDVQVYRLPEVVPHELVHLRGGSTRNKRRGVGRGGRCGIERTRRASEE